MEFTVPIHECGQIRLRTYTAPKSDWNISLW